MYCMNKQRSKQLCKFKTERERESTYYPPHAPFSNKITLKPCICCVCSREAIRLAPILCRRRFYQTDTPASCIFMYFLEKEIDLRPIASRFIRQTRCCRPLNVAPRDISPVLLLLLHASTEAIAFAVRCRH